MPTPTTSNGPSAIPHQPLAGFGPAGLGGRFGRRPRRSRAIKGGRPLAPRARPEEIKTLARSILVAGAVIFLILWGLFSLASAILHLLGVPAHLSPPLALRVLGGALVLAGAALVVWLLRYRRPSTMIVSTYFTFVKMLARSPVAARGGRAEPLIVRGPQRYVRHPLYLGATAAFLGWALLTGAVSTLLGALLALLWFRCVQIPFEERELLALFGEPYARYARQVPALIPGRRAGRRPG